LPQKSGDEPAFEAGWWRFGQPLAHLADAGGNNRGVQLPRIQAHGLKSTQSKAVNTENLRANPSVIEGSAAGGNCIEEL